MKDIKFFFDENEQREYREILQDKSREELIEIAAAATKRYWDAYDIAEKLFDEHSIAAAEYRNNLKDYLRELLARLEQEDRWLDEFAEYFGRQKKYPEEQE